MDTKTKIAAAAFKDFVDLKKKSLHEDLKLGGSKNMLEKFQETPYVEHTPPASAESGGGPHKRNSRVCILILTTNYCITNKTEKIPSVLIPASPYQTLRARY
jgi:hypothetical protein